MSSEEMARLAFGNPGFFDFLAPLARPFKAIAPALSFGASFIPGAGPILSRVIDHAAGLVSDAPDQNSDRLSGDQDTDGDED
jgi:hypothetical protein